MNSIRTRLLLAVLAALVLLVALVGTISYRSVLREAAALFDYHLRQTALSLRDQGEISDDAAAVLSDEQLDMVVQIWRIDGHTEVRRVGGEGPRGHDLQRRCPQPAEHDREGQGRLDAPHHLRG